MDHECAMAVLRNGKAVLMCHRHPDREWVPDVWDFPGGHVEPGEIVEDALVRELHEELGIVIAAPGRPPDEVMTFDGDSVRLSIWFVDYSGPFENRCPDEHDDVRWMSTEAARSLNLADAEYVALIERATSSLG
ncbi:MAG: NUDIX domain-containing protein [Ilumatobacter sp.]